MANVTFIPAKHKIGNNVSGDEVTKLRVAAYCRVSTDSDEQETSYDAQVSHYTMNKLTHGDNVTTDVLARICFALDADVGDIMEIIPDDKGETTHGA